MKKSFLLLFPMTFAVIGIIYLGLSRAATLGITVNLNWDEANCTGTFSPDSYGVNKGDILNVTIHNSASVDMYITPPSGSGFTIPAGGSSSTSVNTAVAPYPHYITGWYNGSACTHGSIASLVIDGAAGSLACNLNASTWSITGSYDSSVASSKTLYKGSQLAATFPYASSSVQIAYPATATDTPFYLRYGTSSSSPIIAQTTCKALAASKTTTTTIPPKSQAAAASPPTASSTSPTSNSPAPKPETSITNKNSSPPTVTTNSNGLVKIAKISVPSLFGLGLIGWALIKFKVIKLSFSFKKLFK